MSATSITNAVALSASIRHSVSKQGVRNMKEGVAMFDERIAVDQSIAGLKSTLQDLDDALDHEQKSEYLEHVDNQGALQSQLTKLILICSVIRERSRRRHLEAAE